MSGPFILARRTFLRRTAAFSALSLAASLDKIGLSSAVAQTPTYKALVCIFLFGGNDSNHMVIPADNDATGYQAYAAQRDAASGVQVPLATLSVINPTNTGGRIFGLHPGFTATNGNPTLAQIFASGDLAVVANCGTLVAPMTKTQYQQGTVARPDNLFSHSDQQQESMSSITKANVLFAITGWGGRLGDLVSSMNAANATPMSMSFSGAQTFGNGVNVRTLALPTGAGFGFNGDGAAGFQTARATARANMLATADPNQVVATAQQMMNAGLSASQRLSPILGGTGSTAITGPFTGLNSGIANQLRAVAKVIEQRATLGHSNGREIFFVSMGGFDTHTGQGTNTGGLANLYTQLGQAMSAFYQATVNLGVAGNVTTFTATDFSRTFKPNGAGTDHAWGGHHFVMGGSVVGTKMYGTFPTLSVTGPDSTDGAGRWIPTTSIEQFGATIGKWFGASSTDLAQVFPNLANFGVKDLGFLA